MLVISRLCSTGDFSWLTGCDSEVWWPRRHKLKSVHASNCGVSHIWDVWLLFLIIQKCFLFEGLERKTKFWMLFNLLGTSNDSARSTLNFCAWILLFEQMLTTLKNLFFFHFCLKIRTNYSTLLGWIFILCPMSTTRCFTFKKIK